MIFEYFRRPFYDLLKLKMNEFRSVRSVEAHLIKPLMLLLVKSTFLGKLDSEELKRPSYFNFDVRKIIVRPIHSKSLCTISRLKIPPTGAAHD